MKKSLIGCIASLAVAVASPAVAQIGAPIFIPPTCDVDDKHFLVRQASLYVKSAAEAGDPEEKNQSLQDAFRVLEDAIDRGEAENGSVWYFLGRAYHMVPDWFGADSAFTRAEGLLPECIDDVDTYRYDLWVNAYNQGVQALQADDNEAAKIHLTNAATIYKKEPAVPFYLGSVLARLGENEEALLRFRERVAMEQADGELKESYDLSVFNIARIFHMGQEWDSAAAWYEAYLQINPGDPDGLQGLGASLEGAGRTDEAAALFAQTLASSENLSSFDLFATGVSLFTAGRYHDAARAFTMGLAKNRYHRDGRYNLAQSYFAIANPSDGDEEEAELTPEQVAERSEAGANMLTAARELIAVDFFNESSFQLLAAAWQIAGDDDSTLAVIVQLSELPFDITITGFVANEDGAEIWGELMNRMPDEITTPMLTFDFIDAEGSVIVSEVIEPTTLAPEGMTEFHFAPTAAGIAAWLYQAGT